MIRIELLRKENFGSLAIFLANFPDMNIQANHKEYWLNSFAIWWQKNSIKTDEMAWLIIENEEIKGVFGIIPIPFWYNGVEKTAYAHTTWFVLPEFRKKSLQVFYPTLKYCEETFLFNTTSSTPAILKIIETLGFSFLPTSTEKLSIIFTNSSQSLQFFLLKLAESKPFLGKILPFLNFFSGLGGILLSIKQGISLHTPSHAQVRLLAKADYSFDQLWEQTQNKFQFTGVRTSQSINWFCDDLNFEKKIFAYYEAEILKGYAIFRFRKAAHRFKQLEMLDFWAENFDKALPPIVSFAKQFARQNQVAFITFAHSNSKIGQILGNMGLQEVFVGKNAYYKAPEEIMDKITTENIYFTHLQGDYGFA